MNFSYRKEVLRCRREVDRGKDGYVTLMTRSSFSKILEENVTSTGREVISSFFSSFLVIACVAGVSRHSTRP